jgi:hypothetical protein
MNGTQLRGKRDLMPPKAPPCTNAAPDIVVTPDMAEVSHQVSMFLAEAWALELIPIFNGLRSDEDRQAVLDFAKFLAEPLRSDGPSAHVVPPRNRPTPFRSR